jgi:hypothetical protein
MYKTRIITFLDHIPLNAPQRLLEGHSRTIEYQGKQRVYCVRKCLYDDATPLYSIPKFNEVRYTSILKLREDHPNYDGPVLDRDQYLKIYDDNK